MEDLLNVSNMSMVNLINSEITRKNFQDKKNNVQLEDVMEQMMSNQYYLTKLLLKLDGFDVDYLEKQLEQKIKFNEQEDRWLWVSK